MINVDLEYGLAGVEADIVSRDNSGPYTIRIGSKVCSWRTTSTNMRIWNSTGYHCISALCSLVCTVRQYFSALLIDNAYPDTICLQLVASCKHDVLLSLHKVWANRTVCMLQNGMLSVLCKSGVVSVTIVKVQCRTLSHKHLGAFFPAIDSDFMLSRAT